MAATALETPTPQGFEDLFWSWLSTDDIDAAWQLWIALCDYGKGLR